MPTIRAGRWSWRRKRYGSAGCADAYVILAQHATRWDTGLDLWRRGVEAGKAALGAAFDEGPRISGAPFRFR